MINTELSDKAIQAQLGNRLKDLRLRHNITQQELAEATRLSVTTIKNLESGNGKLSAIIAVLRELGAIDQLENFIPKVQISPIELAKREGLKRQRATGSRSKQDEDELEW